MTMYMKPDQVLYYYDKPLVFTTECDLFNCGQGLMFAIDEQTYLCFECNNQDLHELTNNNIKILDYMLQNEQCVFLTLGSDYKCVVWAMVETDAIDKSILPNPKVFIVHHG